MTHNVLPDAPRDLAISIFRDNVSGTRVSWGGVRSVQSSFGNEKSGVGEERGGRPDSSCCLPMSYSLPLSLPFCTSLSLSLCLSLSVSVFVSFFLCLYSSLCPSFLCLYISVSLYFCLFLSSSFFISFTVSISSSLCVSLCAQNCMEIPRTWKSSKASLCASSVLLTAILLPH